jgi:hypothetical protein
MPKRKRVAFWRKIKGSKKRKRVVFFSSGKAKRKRRVSHEPSVGRRPHVTERGLRFELSECMMVEGRLRCTVTPLDGAEG